MGLRAVLSIGGSSRKSRLILRLAKLGVSAARASLVTCSSGRPGCLPTGGRTTTSWEGSELMIGGPGPFDSFGQFLEELFSATGLPVLPIKNSRRALPHLGD